MKTINHILTAEFAMEKLFKMTLLEGKDKNECIQVLIGTKGSLEQKVNHYLKNYYMMKYGYKEVMIEKITNYFGVKFNGL